MDRFMHTQVQLSLYAIEQQELFQRAERFRRLAEARAAMQPGERRQSGVARRIADLVSFARLPSLVRAEAGC